MEKLRVAHRCNQTEKIGWVERNVLILETTLQVYGPEGRELSMNRA
jgi:hypothetical protein